MGITKVKQEKVVFLESDGEVFLLYDLMSIAANATLMKDCDVAPWQNRQCDYRKNKPATVNHGRPSQNVPARNRPPHGCFIYLTEQTEQTRTLESVKQSQPEEVQMGKISNST